MKKSNRITKLRPTKAPGQRKRAKAQPAPNSVQASRWNSDFWSYRKHVGLKFENDENLDAAIDLLWSDEELYGLPRVHVGDQTVIVPAEALELIRRKGFKFTIQKVVSAGDLPAEEVNKIRRGETR